MKINADYRNKVVISIESLEWIPSPLPGVKRKMLDRIGDEVARATSIVRYDPNSSFSMHTHDLGEEFLVLSGVFSDQQGDYPALTYCRNPIGSSHAPWTHGGCDILVKLRFMVDNEETQSTVKYFDKEKWTQTETGERLDLYHCEKTGEHVWSEKWISGKHSILPTTGGVEIFLISGSLEDNDSVLHQKNTWIRFPPDNEGKKLEFNVNGNAFIFCKCGHLRHFLE